MLAHIIVRPGLMQGTTIIDDQHVGGSDDLAALDRASELDGMLGLG